MRIIKRLSNTCPSVLSRPDENKLCVMSADSGRCNLPDDPEGCIISCPVHLYSALYSMAQKRLISHRESKTLHYTRGVQKVRRLTGLIRRYVHHILSLFHIVSCN